MTITFYYTPKGSEALEIELKLYDKPNVINTKEE